jgi:S-DNA-T family DNA segregation ATPase FtsK/SpoIIIE
MTPAKPLPVPSPSSLVGLHKADAFLGDVGHRIGLWLSHPHMLTVSSFRGHPASGLALVLIVLALCGVVLSVPAGVWMYKRRHHLRSSIRGLFSLKVWRERWKWHRSFGDVELSGHSAPKPINGWPTRFGATMILRFDDGMTMEIMEKHRASVASTMRCRDIRFRAIHHNQGRGYVDIIRGDSLARSVPWPWLASATTNFLGPVPVAVDMDGQPVYMDLREKNMLVSGVMGSGKSWFLHVLVAAAMLDPRIEVHILDGKMGTGFATWEPACASFATDDEPEEAIRIVSMLNGKLNKIFAAQKAQGERTINWATAKVAHVLFVDEFTAFDRIPGFEKMLNELVRRGRAGGLMVVLATQRPSSKVMDTDLSRLIEYRYAMLSTDSDSSKMGLGTSIVDASKLSGKNPGEGYLLHAERNPIRCRGYSLTDRDLASLAARAQSLRTNSPHKTVQVAGQAMPDTPGSVRSSQLPNLSLVPLPPQPAPLSVQRRAVLQAIAELGPGVEGAVVRAHLGMAPDRFSVHGNALVTAGYATRAAKPLQSPQFGHGRPAWCWSTSESGIKALNASRNPPVARDKEAGAQ